MPMVLVVLVVLSIILTWFLVSYWKAILTIVGLALALFITYRLAIGKHPKLALIPIPLSLLLLIGVGALGHSSFLIPQPPTPAPTPLPKPMYGLGGVRPLTAIEVARATSTAEGTSQVRSLTTQYRHGKDVQVTVVAVVIENARLVYYERLDPLNPETKTLGVNSFFPAVFYHFYDNTYEPHHRYLMVMVDLPTGQVAAIKENPGLTGGF